MIEAGGCWANSVLATLVTGSSLRRRDQGVVLVDTNSAIMPAFANGPVGKTKRRL